MRLFLVGAALLVASNAAAQSRWTISTGPEWYRSSLRRTWGMRFRAEYDLTKPTSIFGLRFETGARWSPSQSYFVSYANSTQSGTEQRFDLMAGLSASLSPMPRARVSPYVTLGVFGRQVWDHGTYYFQSGTFSQSSPIRTQSHGDIIGSLGVGVRARVGGHAFQLELRRLHDHNGLTFGTRLPF